MTRGEQIAELLELANGENFLLSVVAERRLSIRERGKLAEFLDKLKILLEEELEHAKKTETGD